VKARSFLFGLGAIVSPLLLYFAAALISAVFPLSGNGASRGNDSRTIYVCGDIIHTDILVPVSDKAVDWSLKFAGVVDASVSPNDFIAIGWGDLLFFTEFETWSDVTLKGIWGAISGRGPTALRVYTIREPKNSPGCHALLVDEDARRRLARIVDETLVKPEVISVLPGTRQFFFQSHQRYSPFNTCNQWTARSLAAMGLPRAYFAPFSFSVTWPLK
jgi:uncharacterized protein (TIGR02117 family)